MARRIIVRDEKEKPKTFARSLFDGSLPLDVVFSGAIAATRRPGILSDRGDEEDELEFKRVA